jgi:hypothetical protein
MVNLCVSIECHDLRLEGGKANASISEEPCDAMSRFGRTAYNEAIEC